MKGWERLCVWMPKPMKRALFDLAKDAGYNERQIGEYVRTVFATHIRTPRKADFGAVHDTNVGAVRGTKR